MPNPVVLSGWFSLLSDPGFGADGFVPISVPGFGTGGFVPASVPGAGFGAVPSSVPGAGFGVVPSSVPGFGADGFVPVSVPGFTVVELLFSANPLSIFATKYLEISSAFTTSIAPLLPFILPTLLYPVL